jgi:hypothetical protein
MENEPLSDFAHGEWLKIERTSFFVNIFLIIGGYIGVTFWLNAIRAAASLWFVWVLIGIQFILYCSFFATSYGYSRKCGVGGIGVILFIFLAILGRVENWELVIIPLTILGMILLSISHLSRQKSRK